VDVLPTERRVAGKVKSLQALSRRTQTQLTAARATTARATKKLAACQASLSQN
jgi:hypothetical protein